ncbi:MAG: hypothetical protein HUJ26_00360 [Planctomycetaceae bacterium]|nr:hypothetical protein [Planctomycetaceae bacterium]
MPRRKGKAGKGGQKKHDKDKARSKKDKKKDRKQKGSSKTLGNKTEDTQKDNAKSGSNSSDTTVEVVSTKTHIGDFIAQTTPLLDRMRSATERSLLGSVFSMSLPSNEVAAKLIAECYYASMIGDEGRLPQVTLHIAASKDTATDEGLGHAHQPRFFHPPIPAEATAIAKLAHAVSDNCSLAIEAHNNQPVIVGIGRSRSAHLDTFVAQHHEKKRTFRFQVAVRGPGNIDVLCDTGMLSYKAGRVIASQSLLKSKSLEILAGILNAQIADLLGDEFRKKVEKDIERRLPKDKSQEIIGMLRTSLQRESAADCKPELVVAELVWRMSQLGHGGILIFSNRHDVTTLSYKYPTESTRLQKAVTRYWETAYEDGYGTTRVSPSHSPGLPLLLQGAALRESVRETAYLAGTDGAIVLGTDFRLHGFGAIIDKAAVDESSITFVDGNDDTIEYASILKNKGSRHQSSLSFAMRELDSFVFVVSQDGHVTAIAHTDGVVRVEGGLRSDGI